MNGIRWLARLGVAGLVLALTLPPQPPAGTEGLSPLCIACGYQWLSGFVLNVLLLVPLGLAVARPGQGTRGVARAVVVGAVLSLAVEVAQVAIPGRHPALGDLVANTLGAGGGGLLGVSLDRWLRSGRGVVRGVPVAWGGGVAAMLMCTGWLLTPDMPSSEYWVQWAPELRQFETFPGEVLDARAGGRRLPRGRLDDGRRAELAARMRTNPALTVTARFGRPTGGLAPVLSVFDGRQREILVLGQDGDDLVLRLRRQADAVSLRRPDLRAPGLLGDLEPGRVAGLGVRADGGGGNGPGRAARSLCLGAGGKRQCGLGHRVGSGWRLLLDPGTSAAVARWLDGAWVALLFLPLGLWASGRWDWRLGVAAAGGGLLTAPLTGPLLAAGAAEAAGMTAGLVLGASLRPAIRGLRDAAGAVHRGDGHPPS